MLVLNRKTSLRDIEDVEAFVIMCIKRSGIRPEPREYEDLVATGMMMLWEMSLRYREPPGDKSSASTLAGWCFSGYAIKYMPKKMKDAYHRSHEHHLHKTQADGRRRWEYTAMPESWDRLLDNGDEHTYLDETRLRLIGNFIDPQVSIPTKRTGESVRANEHLRLFMDSPVEEGS